jgi:hypothetical protein
MNMKNRLIPISAGTTATEIDANSTPLFKAMKIYAMIMVVGSVPSIPPVLVPNFSAIIVIIITTAADAKNGRIV